MYKIEYEIKINNEGRPYIHLPEEYEDIPENRFFAMEITYYILSGVLEQHKDRLSDEAVSKIAEAAMVIGQVSDEVAALLKEQLKLTVELDKLVKLKYDFHVGKYKELDKLNPEGIIRNNKIYKKKNGLRILVLDEMEIYELENNKWVKKDN
ncbi:MAG: hypothetical protein ACOCVF_01610 [bacterium]